MTFLVSQQLEPWLKNHEFAKIEITSLLSDTVPKLYTAKGIFTLMSRNVVDSF